MMDVNPYMLDDPSATLLSVGVDKAINNEIELMKSELVLDEVIRENILFIPKSHNFMGAYAFFNSIIKIKDGHNVRWN